MAKLPAVFLAGLVAFGAPVKTVSLTTLDWEPYIGEGLPGKGYVYEIVKEAFKRVGYKVDVTFYPWARALAVSESGKADGLFPEYFAVGRETRFVYSSAFPGGPVGLLARKEDRVAFPADPQTELTRALQGMRQYRFGVVRGYINTKAFDSADFLQKEEAVSDEQNIQKLQARHIDLIFIDKFVAQHLIGTRFPQFASELEFLEPPLEVKPLYVVFSKKAPGYEQKRKDFNEGLAKLQKTGAIRAIMKKYGF